MLRRRRFRIVSQPHDVLYFGKVKIALNKEVSSRDRDGSDFSEASLLGLMSRIFKDSCDPAFLRKGIEKVGFRLAADQRSFIFTESAFEYCNERKLGEQVTQRQASIRIIGRVMRGEAIDADESDDEADGSDGVTSAFASIVATVPVVPTTDSAPVSLPAAVSTAPPLSIATPSAPAAGPLRAPALHSASAAPPTPLTFDHFCRSRSAQLYFCYHGDVFKAYETLKIIMDKATFDSKTDMQLAQYNLPASVVDGLRGVNYSPNVQEANSGAGHHCQGAARAVRLQENTAAARKAAAKKAADKALTEATLQKYPASADGKRALERFVGNSHVGTIRFVEHSIVQKANKVVEADIKARRAAGRRIKRAADLAALPRLPSLSQAGDLDAQRAAIMSTLQDHYGKTKNKLERPVKLYLHYVELVQKARNAKHKGIGIGAIVKGRGECVNDWKANITATLAGYFKDGYEPSSVGNDHLVADEEESETDRE